MGYVDYCYTVEHQAGPFCSVVVPRLQTMTAGESVRLVPDVFLYLTAQGFTILGLGYGGIVFCRRDRTSGFGVGYFDQLNTVLRNPTDPSPPRNP